MTDFQVRLIAIFCLNHYDKDRIYFIIIIMSVYGRLFEFLYADSEKGTDNMTLGEKIYKLRTEKGLSQEAFGEVLNVSRQSVSKWETDQSVPELDKLVAISDFFEVSTDYLLKEDEEEDKLAVNESESSYNIVYRYKRPHYEYKSKKMVGSLPLVHVNIGTGLYRAKGIIAIGNMAQGCIAIGFLAMGGLSVGIFSVGLLTLACLAVGVLAYGTVAVGVISFGAFSIGIFSIGALSVGQFAFGASAKGAQVAIGDVARGKVALGYSQAIGDYTQVSNRQPFDYESACRAIDAQVSSNWLFFKTWAKAMIKFF